MWKPLIYAVGKKSSVCGIKASIIFLKLVRLMSLMHHHFGADTEVEDNFLNLFFLSDLQCLTLTLSRRG